MARCFRTGLTGLALLVPLYVPAQQGAAAPQEDPPSTSTLAQDSPTRGFLAAHVNVQHPLTLLGGPTTVTVQQNGGGVMVALPDNRKLDPVVFGTPSHPLAFGGTPIAEGVPLKLRGTQDGHYTQLKQKTPFGDAHQVLGGASLQMTLVDATATDAARSDDTVQFDASWKDDAGNVYEVRCHQGYPHGSPDGHPTYGGVLLNHMMHGFSRIGTPLMPSLFCYAAFWGPGEVLKNGQVLDQDRLVHVMLTEYVRGKDYTLDFDKDVTPTRLQLHLIVPPMRAGKPAPVKTGFKLPNGEDLPFWHVMFDNLDIQAQHQTASMKFPQTSQPVAAK